MDKNQQKIEQILLAKQVYIPETDKDLVLHDDDLIGTFDIQYQDDKGSEQTENN